MMNNHRPGRGFALTISLATLLILGGCEEQVSVEGSESLAAEVVRIEDAMAEIRRYRELDQPRALAETEDTLDRVDRYLAVVTGTLHQEKDSLSAEALARREAMLALLQQQRGLLQQQYQQLEEQNISRWDRGMARLEQGWERLLGLFDYVADLHSDDEKN